MAVVELENDGRRSAVDEGRLAELTIEELEDQVAEIASHIYAGTCRWLELVAELDRRGGWAQWGCGSCAEWLAWRCALMPRAAREHVRVARRLPELPLTHAAFARGQLSYAKVRALTRVARPETEDELLELARHLTAAQLERAVRAYRRVSTDEAAATQAAAYVGYYWDDDGSLVLQGRLAPEDGALLLRALEAARDTLRERAECERRDSAEPAEPGRGSAEPHVPPPLRPTNADAMVAMADTALASGPGGRSGGDRYQVVVHVDAAAISGDAEGGCTLDDGPSLAPETARRLACDSSVVQIDELGGEALAVGRRRRTIPPALRRALEARDRGCRFPGCENHRFVDAHHVRHWARGGETALDNLILLCRRHHRLVHEGGYSCEMLPGGGARFRDPWGGPIPYVPRPPPAAWADLLAANRRSGVAVHAETCESGDGEPMDLGLAVEALIQSLDAREL
jgi:hypothetical protein